MEGSETNSNQVEIGWLLDDEQLVRGVEIYILKYANQNDIQFFTPAVVASIQAIDPNQPHVLHGIYNLEFTSRNLLLPVNMMNHWFLLRVQLDAPLIHATVFDSLAGTSIHRSNSIARILAGIVTLLQNPSFSKNYEDWKNPQITQSAFPLTFRQQNGFDCGFFVFEWIRYLALGIPVSTTQEGIIVTRNLLYKASTQSTASLSSEREIFISFSGPDGSAFASHLHREIALRRRTQAFWDIGIRIGDNKEDILSKELRRCKIFACIITPAYLSSPWTLWELVSVYQRFLISNSDIKIIPLFIDVDPHQVIGMMEDNFRNISSINLLRPNISKDLVINALNMIIGFKGVVATFSSVQDKLREYTSSIMRTATILSRASLLDENAPPLPRLISKTPALIETANKLLLTSSQESALLLGLVGVDGIGKTATASIMARSIVNENSCAFLQEIASSLSNRYPGGVCWLSFEEDEDGIDQGCQLQSFLDGTDPLVARQVASARSLPITLQRASVGQQALIVLDNITIPDQLAIFRYISNSCCILATSRHQRILEDEHFAIIDLSSSNQPNWGGQFLSSLCGTSASPVLCNSVATVLGNHVFLLSVVANICLQSANPNELLESVLERLSNQQSTTSIALLQQPQKTLSNILSTLQNSEFLTHLRYFGGFPSNTIIPTTIYNGVLQKVGLDPLTINDTIRTARDFCLIQCSASHDIILHPIFLDYLRSDSEWTQRKQLISAALRDTIISQSSTYHLSNVLRLNRYLKVLVESDVDSIKNALPDVFSTDANRSIFQCTNHIFEMAVDKNDVTAALSMFGLMMRSMVNTTIDVSSPTAPDEIGALFQLLVSSSVDIEEVRKCLASLTKEHLFKNGRLPRYTMQQATTWANHAKEGFGATHLACLHKNPELLQMLLDHGAQVPTMLEGFSTQRDELFLATSLGSIECVQLLINAGCNDKHESSCSSIYGTRHFLLDDAALSDPSALEHKRSIPENIPGAIDLNRMSERSGSWCYLHSIHIAIIHDHTDIVQLLLDSGVAARSHASIGYGWVDIAILHCKSKSLEIVLKFLMEKSTSECTQQASRYIKGELPSEKIKWFKDLSARSDNLGSLVNSFENEIERNRENQQKQDLNMLQSGGFEVYVKTLTGKSFIVVCFSTDTVAVLKRKIWEKEGIDIDSQRIIFFGKQLEDDRQIVDYGLHETSSCKSVHLVLRMRGGEINSIQL